MKFLKPTIGLALGGGGAKGAAHLGVLRYLYEKDIELGAISGTSAGAIVAALYAFGLTPEEIKEALLELDPLSIKSLRIGELGLLKNLTLESMLKKHLPEEARIEHATIPLAIHATDLTSGEGVDFYSGDVVEAVLASTSVPGIYIPQKMNDRLLVDGGLTENVPVNSLRKLGAKAIVAVNLNGQRGYHAPETIFDCITNSIEIAIDSQTRFQLRKVEIKIELDLVNYSRFDLKDLDELERKGHEAANAVISRAYKITFLHYVNKMFRLLNNLLPPVIERLFHFRKS